MGPHRPERVEHLGVLSGEGIDSGHAKISECLVDQAIAPDHYCLVVASDVV